MDKREVIQSLRAFRQSAQRETLYQQTDGGYAASRVPLHHAAAIAEVVKLMRAVLGKDPKRADVDRVFL